MSAVALLVYYGLFLALTPGVHGTGVKMGNGRVRPRLRRPQRLRRAFHAARAYGYAHKKIGEFSPPPTTAISKKPVVLPSTKGMATRPKWTPPLPPKRDRRGTSGIWEPIPASALSASGTLELRVDHEIRAHCDKGPTLEFRTYRRDLAENFRYLVQAILYAIGTNSSLVLRPPEWSGGKNVAKTPMFGCFSKKKDVAELQDVHNSQHPHASPHRSFLLTNTMQGCLEPIQACGHPALVPSALSYMRAHHLNTKNTVIDWNVWEDKNEIMGVYGDIMEMGVNEHLTIPSVSYYGPRWEILRTIGQHLWHLSPHMKHLMHREYVKMRFKKAPSTTPFVGVHLTPLRSSQKRFAEKKAGELGIGSKTVKGAHAPFGLYLMALERVWQEAHGNKDGSVILGGGKSGSFEKVLFLYATNIDDTAAFVKEAQAKGWKTLNFVDETSTTRAVPHLQTLYQVMAMEIFRNTPRFVGAGSTGLSWSVQAIRENAIASAVSLDDPWSQKLLSSS